MAKFSAERRIDMKKKRAKSGDAEEVRVLSCDKRDGESSQGCEKYLPLINCERGEIPD